MGIELALNQTVSWERRTSRDGAGQGVFAPPETEAARVEQKLSSIRTTEGRIVVSPTRVFLRPDWPGAVGDRINSQEVAWVSTEQGLDGPDHRIAFLSTAGGG